MLTEAAPLSSDGGRGQRGEEVNAGEATDLPSPVITSRLPSPSPLPTTARTSLPLPPPLHTSSSRLGSPAWLRPSTEALNKTGRGDSLVLLSLNPHHPSPFQHSLPQLPSRAQLSCASLPDTTTEGGGGGAAAVAGGGGGVGGGAGGGSCAFLSSADRLGAAAATTTGLLHRPAQPTPQRRQTAPAVLIASRATASATSHSFSSSAFPSVPPSSAVTSFPSASPSFSLAGFGVGFASSAVRFPRTRRLSPGPAAEWAASPERRVEGGPAMVASLDPHWATTSAAFHSANHDGQHLPPRPSRPRTAPATGQVTAPSVPFLSPYFTRTPTPAPNAYQPRFEHTTPHSTATGAAGLSRAPRTTSAFLLSPSSSSSSPSPTSYSPQLSTVRPRPSTAASTPFASLAERSGHATAIQGDVGDCGHHRLGAKSTVHRGYSQVHRPGTAALPLGPSSSFHPPQLPVDRWGRPINSASASSASPSPLSYHPEQSIRAVSHSAPAHSFAPPTRPVPTADGGEAPRMPCGSRSFARALSVEDEGGYLSSHRSFLYNHRQLWV